MGSSARAGRESIVERFRVPERIWWSFLLVSVFALVAPHLGWLLDPKAGETNIFGYQTPVLSAEAKRLLIYLGPALVVAALAIHAPLLRVPAARGDGAAAGDASAAQVECEGVLAGAKGPTDYTLVDLGHGQDDWDDYSAGLRATLPDFCKPLHDLAERTALDRARVVILALPRRAPLVAAEIEAVADWVECGGGLLLLGYYAWTHHDTNVNELARRFGIEFADDLALLGDATEIDARRQVFGRGDDLSVRILRAAMPRHPLFEGIGELALQSASTVRLAAGTVSEAVARAPDDASVWAPDGEFSNKGVREVIARYEKVVRQREPLIVALRRGRGRVVAVGTWKIVSHDIADNRRFVRNAIAWLGAR